MKMTKGEYRIGVSFNPSQDPTVAEIKDRAARLIDLIDSVSVSVGAVTERDAQASEIARLKALAQTAIEEGAMWAVKAATKPPLDQ
jgi:hypothetical protein